MRIIVTAGALALMACSTIALAQSDTNTVATTTTTTAATSTTTSTSATVKPKSDPNKIVCETMETLGTRLGGHRECKTRAQWAEERRANRESIDRAQTLKTCSQSGGC